MHHPLADKFASTSAQRLDPQSLSHGLERWLGLPVLIGLLAVPPAPAQTAGFTGVFDAGLWDYISGGAGAEGTISATTLTLLGSLNGDFNATRTLYSISVADSYRISFDWSFTAYDPAGADWDPVGFTRASDYQLSMSFGGTTLQSGSVTNAFFSGGTFSFYSESDNWSAPDGAALLTITNFTFTLAAPDDDGLDAYAGAGGGGGSGGGDTPPPPGTVVWTGAGNDDWTQTGNWNSAAPDAILTANITNGDAVTLADVGSARALHLENGSSLTISEGGSLTLADTYESLTADHGSTLTVTGENSTLVANGSLTLHTSNMLVDDHAVVTTGNAGLATQNEDEVSTVTVSDDARWTLTTLNIGGAGVATLNVRSGGVVEATERIYVRNGSLNIDSGGTVFTTYAGISGSDARVTVDGAGSAFTVNGRIDVGSGGTGTMTISNGAVVTSTGGIIGYYDGGRGTVTVTGEGSTWFTRSAQLGVSSDTEGHLFITNGGVVHNSGSYISIANLEGATASLTITGAGSLLTGGQPTDTVPRTTGLMVGNGGNATLLVSDGGKINGSGGSIGSAFGGTGTATITGLNSSWTMTSSFSMDSTSSLTIADGATFTTGGSSIANTAGFNSTITIGGIGSSWADSSSVVIGYGGSATLNINDGASVSTVSWMRLGQLTGSQGTIIQTGGTLDIGGYLHFHLGTAVYRLEGGVLKVGDTSSAAGITKGTGNYTFELAGGTIEAKRATLTIQPDATLRGGTTTTLHTPGSASQTMYFEGVLRGAGALRKTGAGALYLDAMNNTFSGGITIQQGIVNPYYAGSLGTGALTFAGDSTLQVDARSMSIGNAINIHADVTANIDVAGGYTLTHTGNITGAGALDKTSAGTLILAGTNTYAGPTRIAAGTLIFAKAAAFYNGDSSLWTDANFVVESGATASFRVGGDGEFTASDVDDFRALGSASGGFKNGASLGFDTTNAAGGFTYASLIGDTNNGENSLGIAKTGVGTLTLTGANTYTGGTTITGGTLVAGHATALGTGVIRLGGAALQGNGAALALDNALDLIASNSTIGGASDLAFGGLLRNTLAGSTTLNITNTGATTFNNVSLSPSGNRTVTFNTTGGPVAIAGVIANGAGSSGLTKTGAGILTLSGANTYTGATTLTTGTLALGNDSALGTGTLTLNGGTLSGDGTARTLSNAVTLSANSAIGGSSALTFAGAITNSGGNRTLTLNNTALTTFGTIALSNNNTARQLTFAGPGDALVTGAIANGGSGAGAVIKNGTGTLTLSGASTYTGVTSVNAGKLFVNGSLANTAVTVASGATLGGAGSIGGLTTIQSGGRLAAGNSPGTLTFTRGLALATGSILDFELGEVSDLVRISGGTFSASGTITVNIFDSGGFEAGTYTLFNATGASLSSIGANSFVIGQAIDGFDYTFSLNDNFFFLTATAVPEPASAATLVALLSLGVAACRRPTRRRQDRDHPSLRPRQ